ncbi:Pentatricopeptide repeat-containing protein At5g50990, partial [Linum perenne]
HLLEACKLSSDIRTATETHTRVIRFGYGTHPSLMASLISVYAHCDRLNLARKVFDNMPDRDVVTWNSMIGGYVKNRRFEEALRLFKLMLSSNVGPDKFTFASLMPACAKLGSLPQAQWLHQLMIDKGIEVNSILVAAMIDMYSKCGGIDAAKSVFERVQRDDASIWNSMINGFAIHGFALDAIAVFSKMAFEDVSPDSITFLGLLTACSHSGLVKEGRHYFSLMKSRYSLEPQQEHYGALVDLLGRAGLLEEAHAVITSMPFEPDVVTWRALLSACRMHKTPEIGELAIANISRLKSGDYVLLSNIYCSQQKWDSAQRVREMMNKHGVSKKKGISWFEWAGRFHHFKSGDRSHPETAALYNVLGGLIEKAKLVGFVPKRELVMMDVSEEEKEENLRHHSEKLALAYGILKTGPGTEIRISKNLRICDDCHSWFKFVSMTLNRVILVRDRIRFHRFEGGSCSCGEYW